MDLTMLLGGVELLIAKTGWVGVALVCLYLGLTLLLAIDIVRGLWQMGHRWIGRRAIRKMLHEATENAYHVYRRGGL
jgi:hypothetical protein